MRFAKLIPLTGMLSLAATLPACNTAPPVSGCSELARSILTTPTEHAVIGNTGDPALDWQLYGQGETGQLNKANDKSVTGFTVINQCELRDQQIRRSLNRWRLF